jgi:hypothetical protein
VWGGIVHAVSSALTGGSGAYFCYPSAQGCWTPLRSLRRPSAKPACTLCGVEELAYNQIAAKVQQTLGIPVRYENIDISAFAAELTTAGASSNFVQQLSNVAQDHRDGMLLR